MRHRIVVLVALLAIAAPIGLWSATRGIGAHEATPITNPADFRAFYCASRVMLAGRDPYRTEPLRSCEHRAAQAYGLAMLDGLVLAAPLPPDALALLAPIAALPFEIASPLWLVLSLAAYAVGVLLVTRLTPLPLVASALALGGAVAYVSVPLGQLVPLEVALLCAAALALRRERFAVAAVLCALATIEPHVGLPAVLALVVWERRVRLPLALAGTGLAALAALAAGPAACVAYARDVLPAHALSQVDDVALQFSLTSVLFAAGASARAALAIGTLSYAAMTIAGVAVAGRLASRLRDRAYLALMPPAFAVFGGAFVHLAQIAVAVPALALLLGPLARERGARAVALAALVALSIPWRSLADAPPFAAALWPHPVPPRAAGPLPAGPETLAESTEIAFRRAGGYGANGGSLETELALKLPTWFGLFVLVALAGDVAFGLRPGLRDPWPGLVKNAGSRPNIPL